MRINSSEGVCSPKKLLCFDLDGTLSQHKSHLPEANKALLRKLDAKYKLIMVGAGNAPRIYKQMEQYPIDIIANYGMQESVVENGEFKIIREDTVAADRDYFNTTCQYLREKYGYTSRSEEPRKSTEGCQRILFSFCLFCGMHRKRVMQTKRSE